MSLACTRAKDVFLLVGSKVTVRKRVSKGEEDEGETTPADSFTGIKNDASIQREIDAIHLICKVNKKFNSLSESHDRWWQVASRKMFNDTLAGIKNDASIQREIDAIHLICKVNKKSNPLSGPHDRWWPVLCNQSARHSGMRHHRARKSTGMG